ncbi:MAG: hypothetical protein ABH871_07120 [Pseudomonadota bacterium]
MKSNYFRIFLAVLMAALSLSAFGCSGVPMPEKTAEYKTTVEHVKIDDADELAIVTVKFDIEVENQELSVDIDEVQSAFEQCSTDGSCGTTALLKIDGNDVDGLLSCACRLGEPKTEGSKYVVDAECKVPIDGGLKQGKEYKLKLITVAPVLESEENYFDKLYFSSSPEFVVSDTKLVKNLENNI